MEKRLKQYTALTAAVLAGGGINAQVVYTDVSPDAVVGDGRFRFPINFNGDRYNEFVIKQYNYTTANSSSSYTAIINELQAAMYGSSAYAAYSVKMISSSSYYFLLNLAPGEKIGSQLYFGTSVYPTSYWFLAAKYKSSYESISEGNFIGKEGYVGVRFNIDGQRHYGWIRLAVSADQSAITVYDFAYESTPNKAISAGQKD